MSQIAFMSARKEIMAQPVEDGTSTEAPSNNVVEETKPALVLMELFNPNRKVTCNVGTNKQCFSIAIEINDQN